MSATYHVISAGLNLRAQPDPASAIKAVLAQGDPLMAAGAQPVTAADGNVWVNMRNAAGVAGWVNRKFTDMPTTFRVTSLGLNLRAQPDPGSAIREVLAKDDILEAAGEDSVTQPGGTVWVNARSAAGMVGWVNKKFTDLPNSPGDRLTKAIQLAETAVGQEYVWGGESFEEGGFDCSGLIYWSYRAHGFMVPRVAQDQYTATDRIAPAALRAGDLVFYTKTYETSVPVTHVGIYVGDNRVLMAIIPSVTHVALGTWSIDKLYGYGRV